MAWQLNENVLEHSFSYISVIQRRKTVVSSALPSMAYIARVNDVITSRHNLTS